MKIYFRVLILMIILKLQALQSRINHRHPLKLTHKLNGRRAW